MESLPRDVVVLIGKLLPADDLVALSQTSRGVRQHLLADNRLWSHASFAVAQNRDNNLRRRKRLLKLRTKLGPHEFCVRHHKGEELLRSLGALEHEMYLLAEQRLIHGECERADVFLSIEGGTLRLEFGKDGRGNELMVLFSRVLSVEELRRFIGARNSLLVCRTCMRTLQCRATEIWWRRVHLMEMAESSVVGPMPPPAQVKLWLIK